MTKLRYNNFLAEPWVHGLPLELRVQLGEGKTIVVGNKILVVCDKCRSVVQVNKWLFGSMHICAEDP